MPGRAGKLAIFFKEDFAKNLPAFSQGCFSLLLVHLGIYTIHTITLIP